MGLLQRFSNDESGATAIEYGLLVGLLSLAVLIALSTLSTQLGGLFEWVAGQMAGIGA